MTDFEIAFALKHHPFEGPCNDETRERVVRSISAFTRTNSRNGNFRIGLTSGANTETVCRERWNQTYKPAGMNRMAVVYQYHNRDSILNMAEHLRNHYGDEIGQIGRNLGTGNPPYMVFIAWNDTTTFRNAFVDDGEPIYDRGNMRRELTDMSKRVQQLTADTKYRIYVGKTSSGRYGCGNRWSNTYIYRGMNRMAIVYTTDNQDTALEMETALMEELRRLNIEFENDNAGGGGRRAGEDRTPFIVYIAWKLPQRER